MKVLIGVFATALLGALLLVSAFVGAVKWFYKAVRNA